jgi:peptidoglycan/xylan/chitin deacetylase (PgdA/CDA1 family)
MFSKICIIICVLICFCFSDAHGGEKKGGIALAFDDGYANWIDTIAPELAKVGGVATCFVNNQRIHNGHLSFTDLLILQNTYGWEIGTHTFHHFNAVEYVERNGIDDWVKNELESSVSELQSHDLNVLSLAFPFNTFNPELGGAVLKSLESFRYASAYPIADHKNSDGSYNAAPFDTSRFVPLELIYQWIDFAYQQDCIVFLYDHQILKDEEFYEGIVVSVSGREIVSKNEVKPFGNDEFCLVPDTRRRIHEKPIKIERTNGKTITTFRNDLSKLTTPGATFIIGPCYGVPLSYFRKLIDYASKKVVFYTVHDALNKLPMSVSP